MKKIILAVLVVAFVHTSFSILPAYIASKQTNSQLFFADVPHAVLNNFSSMFSDAKSVKWRILHESYDDNIKYVALFKKGNVKRTARYAPNGTYLGGS